MSASISQLLRRRAPCLEVQIAVLCLSFFFIHCRGPGAVNVSASPSYSFAGCLVLPFQSWCRMRFSTFSDVTVSTCSRGPQTFGAVHLVTTCFLDLLVIFSSGASSQVYLQAGNLLQRPV